MTEVAVASRADLGPLNQIAVYQVLTIPGIGEAAAAVFVSSACRASLVRWVSFGYGHA